MGTYYYVASSSSAAWSTANSTTVLNDNSAGDTSTGLTQTGPGSFSPAQITLFYDNGSQASISGQQFTGKYTPTGGQIQAGSWTLYGSNDHSTWTTITSSTNTVPGDSSFHTATSTGLSGTYQYFRLGFVIFAGTGGNSTWFVTDWLLTLGAPPAARRANAMIMIE